MSNPKPTVLYILLFLTLGGLVFFTVSFSSKNNAINTELESIKSGGLYNSSIKYESLSPDVFTTVELEDEDGNVLLAKVLEGSVENGSLTGKVSLETDSGEVIDATVINVGTESILEDIDGNTLIAKLGQQWILPTHFSQESLDYLSNEISQEIILTPEQIEDLSAQLDLDTKTTESILTGSQILTKLGDNWLLVDDLSGEATTYISDEIATAISNINFPDTSLTNGSVLEAHLASGSVSGSKIQNGIVTVSHMATNSVSSAQIIDGNVSLAKLASNSVDSSKLVNGSIVNEDISNTANIDWDKISKIGADLSDLSNRNAQYLSVADTGGYFTGSDLETVLSELADGTTLDGRYLQSYSETDPVYLLSVASGITNTNITNWNSAYGWGDHGVEGYLTSEVDGSTTNELQNLFSQITDGTNNALVDSQADAFRIVAGDNISVLVGNDDATYGDYLLISSVDEYVGTLTSLSSGNGLSGGTITSTGTLSINSPTCSGTDKLQWNGTGFICSTDLDTNNYIDGVSFASGTGILTFTRSGLGDLTVNLDGRYLQSFTEADPVFGASASAGITNTNITNWNSAYDWGDHGAEGYSKLTCPTGMIPVPATNGDNGFCVDKYEAKQSGSVAVSQAAGGPWVSINQYDAREACLAAGKHLITEEEWLQIAQNVEQVGWNWNGGVVGTNFMSDGHSDNAPASALVASTDDDPCAGTGQTCDLTTWNTQRRIYKLSNGEYIWDMGGNVWEWTDEATINDYPILNNWAGWTACTTPDGICGNTIATNDQRYGGNTTALRGFLRGGYWYGSTYSGPFALHLGHTPSFTNTSIGFRCAR